MNYWLHRNTGGDNAAPYAKSLLDKGLLSIGWSAFSTKRNKDLIHANGWAGVDKLHSEYGWPYGRNRYCLSRFIAEMKKGDMVVVPTPGRFSIYEIQDDEVYSNEDIDPTLFTDENGIPAERVTRDGYFIFLNNQGNEIDLGFYRRVKLRIYNRSRYDRIEPGLYNKMRSLMTNININDVGYAIDNILSDKKEDTEVQIIPTIVSTKELFEKPLSIPIYQRPYVWGIENVEQLLCDIKKSMDQGKDGYRIGSIILHENSIVDGQQRISTLALIRRVLKESFSGDFQDKCNLTYSHTLSFDHLRQNYDYIRTWISKLTEIKGFAEYLETKCEYVVLEITGKDGLSLAFKLFDSQNGRGKPLEAYNLLKAYHLRAMEGASPNEKIECDRQWEQATRFSKSPRETATYDILKHLFDEQLYRSRVWARNRSAWGFSKKQIREFKGMYIDKAHGPEHPFQNRQMLMYMTEKFYNAFLMDTMSVKSRFNGEDESKINPFTSISQPIVNGKDFFEYINTYTEIYKKMFLELDSYQLKDFKDFYKKYCLEYDGHWRTGDNYVREMYKSITLYLFDKFGEDVLNRYYEKLYLLCYYLRRSKQKVYYQTVAEYPQKFFAIINNAKSESDLKALDSELHLKVTDGFVDKEERNKFQQYEQVVKRLIGNNNE